MAEKKSLIIGIFAGILIGMVASVFFASMIIYAIGESFKIENMNVTVEINQSRLEDFIKQSPGYQKQLQSNKVIPPEPSKEFKHILFAGATFEYDKYVILAWDISPGKAYFRVLQNGNDAFNGVCYANKICNIKNISFQIDDIHIGNESSYLVHWSDK